MKYINCEMLRQERPCAIRFILNSEKVNTIRYDSDKYESARGEIRQFNLYIPREVFLDIPIPDQLTVQIGVDID